MKGRVLSVESDVSYLTLKVTGGPAHSTGSAVISCTRNKETHAAGGSALTWSTAVRVKLGKSHQSYRLNVCVCQRESTVLKS